MLLAVFSNDDRKLNTGLTAEWFRNWFCEKYTWPMLVVDSSRPPRMPMTIKGMNRMLVAVAASRRLGFFAQKGIAL